MTNQDAVVADEDIDNPVDVEIANCLNLASPRSFFLFAGAGSGKTRSLVIALRHVQEHLGEALKLKGQRVGVITFTNAASDEIKRRLSFDPIIDVKTIHSFAWSLIDGLNRDIREWLRTNLATDIEQLQNEEAKGRKGTKASATRLSKIASKSKRLQNLDSVKRFVYSPTGDNRGRDALNHSEVIQLTSNFLRTKPVMQSILVGRYPFLLIDESQDTNKNLIDALFEVQAAHKGVFVLGLIGDMMQRIYSDGKDGLGQSLPADWATPGKQLNHRCPKRVVTLINKVRSTTDQQQQKWRSDSIDGCVRLFILPSDTSEKLNAERAIARHMAHVSGDDEWSGANRRHSRASPSNIAWLQDAWAFLTCSYRSMKSKVGARAFLRERCLLCVFLLKKFSPSCRQSSARTTLPLRALREICVRCSPPKHCVQPTTNKHS